MSATIRILVADDHPVVRDGLVMMLGTQGDFEVVAEAEDGQEAFEKAASYQPDVLLLDLEMPGLDGVQVLEKLLPRYPGMRAIVFTAFDTDERILAALKAGAQGYLLKGAPREELFQAVRVVHEGGSLLQPVIASRVLQHMSAGGDTRKRVSPEGLTEREMEVLQLLAQGLPNKDIASELVISERTVKFHVSSILDKLGAANRTEAVAIAAQQGIIDL